MKNSTGQTNEMLSEFERQRNLLNDNLAKLKNLLDVVERAKKSPKLDSENSRKLAALQALISSERFSEDLESLKKNVAKCKSMIQEHEQKSAPKKPATARRKQIKVLNKA